jgi:hypothetical protein
MQITDITVSTPLHFLHKHHHNASPKAIPPLYPLTMSSSSSEDDPSAQLHATLRASITASLSTRRPLLTHLNADTTWLLSLPYPPTHPSKNGQIYYHILIDPWLKGGQSDVARFFSTQWHKEESAAQTIGVIEDIIQGIEDVARGDQQFPVGDLIVVDTRDDTTMLDANTLKEELLEKGTRSSIINAVLISHEFTDHMHQATLLELSPSVLAFATQKAASIIRSWKHFNFVAEIPRFCGDWRLSSLAPLPDWLGVSRVAYAGNDLLYYHSALMITFPLSGTGGEAEAVVYTPHGISPADLAPVATTAEPKIHTLALLHGLQDISLGAQLNMGAHNGLKVQRLLGSRYWVGTHDEVKRGGGIVSWFLERKVVSLREAMERERLEVEGKDVDLGEVRFEDVGNGESLVLE